MKHLSSLTAVCLAVTVSAAPVSAQDVTSQIDELSEVADGVVADVVEDVAEEVTEEAVEAVVEDVTEEVTEEAVEAVVEDVTEEVTEEAVEAVVEDVAEEVTEEAVEAVVEDVTEEAVEAVVEDVTEDVTEDPTEETSVDVETTSFEDIAASDPALDVTVNDEGDVDGMVMLSDVLFGFGDATLEPSAIDVLRGVAAKLEDIKALEITGHTDAVGREADNLALGQERADAVRDWLLENSNLTADMVTARGVGEADPIAENELEDGSDNPDGRAANRRVEFTMPEES